TNPSRVLCGTSTGFYLSSDGGVGWTRQDTPAPNKFPTANVRCEGDFSLTDNDVYVSMPDINNGEVWRSTDAGANWSRRATNIGFGGYGWYNNAVWVDPTNSSVVLAGGRNLRRSTDGGLTFTIIGGDGRDQSIHSDLHAIVSHPTYDGNINRVVWFGCDGGA